MISITFAVLLRYPSALLQPIMCTGIYKEQLKAFS